MHKTGIPESSGVAPSHRSNVFSLEGRVALVTGGGTGLGYAMTSCLAAAGAKVIITGRRKDVLAQAAEKLGANVYPEPHDITDLSAASKLIARIEKAHGAPTILINNAGTHVKKTVEEHTHDDFRNILATHVEGAFALTRAAVPAMKRAGGGSVILISSMSALMGLPLVVAYSAAKSAYHGLVRSMAAELGPDNIRVNAIAPGWIETPMLDKALSGDPERSNKILSRTPLGRFGTPEDIGWCAAYLCSPAAAFITGAVIPVDGGASIGF
ncbi:MAG TPA: SDR family NAD(P)-dependent oxidoreductase [Acidobacteriaceae bacterium]|nr:SDR family NAD(P)-dependent oxidoreductase [Acidobacteriaceae bacterium]